MEKNRGVNIYILQACLRLAQPSEGGAAGEQRQEGLPRLLRSLLQPLPARVGGRREWLVVQGPAQTAPVGQHHAAAG